MNPLVVHVDHARFDVFIGRPSKWGNPFHIGRDGNRAEVIAKYEAWLMQQPALLACLHELRGKILGCYCAPDACHGDVLARLSNTPQKPERVAIVGSRDYLNLAAVRRYVLALPKGTIIISGGARGVDRAGELAAREAGLEVVIYWADWDTHGKEAGLLRNGSIVRDADRVVVFWDGKSRGSAHTIALCKALGKPYEVITCRRAPIGGSDNPGVFQPLPGAVQELPAMTAAQATARRRRGRG
jgi:hypothetical protein